VNAKEADMAIEKTEPVATKKAVEAPPAPAPAPAPESSSEIYARRMEGMLEISNLVGSVMELDDILDQIVRLTAEMFGFPVCSIYLLGPRRENLTLRAAVGVQPEEVGAVRIPVGHGLIGQSVQNNEMIAVDDAHKDPRFRPIAGRDESLFHALITAPVRVQEQVVGALVARRPDVHAFAPEETMLFETICKQVAIVIEKSQMYFGKLEADRLAAISISLSEVAHYIKNLLQGMKGGIYFVDQGLKRGELETARRGWEVLQRGNKKIASLVENMLNYSRDMSLQLEKHNVNSIVFDILHQIDDTAVSRGVALIPEPERDLPSIQLDQDRIYDALLNLITNAIDAIPEGQEDSYVIIRTRLNKERESIEIIVEDNGAGMSPEVQKKIFNLFFSTKADRGTGIGLSVTRKVIEKHHGRIDVESVLGKGSKFIVQLPLRQPPRE